MDLKLAKNQTQSYSQWAQITCFSKKLKKYFKLQTQEELSKLKERIQIVDATPTIAAITTFYSSTYPHKQNKTTHEMIIIHNNVDLELLESID